MTACPQTDDGVVDQGRAVEEAQATARLEVQLQRAVAAHSRHLDAAARSRAEAGRRGLVAVQEAARLRSLLTEISEVWACLSVEPCGRCLPCRVHAAVGPR